MAIVRTIEATQATPAPANGWKPQSLATRLVADARREVHPPLAVALVAAMTVLGLASIAFVPAQPARQSTFVEQLVDWAVLVPFILGSVFAWLGAAQGRRYAFYSALSVTGLLMLTAASCPLSGHHTAGLWVIGSVGTAGAALALNVAALRTTR